MHTSTKVLLGGACFLLAACAGKAPLTANNSFRHNGKSYLICPSPKMIRYQTKYHREHWNGAHGSVWAIINHTSGPLPEFSEDHKIRLMFAEVGHNRALCRYIGVTDSGRKTYVEAQLQPHAFAKITTAGNNWRNCSHQQRCNKVCYAVRTDVCPFSLRSPSQKSSKSTAAKASTGRNTHMAALAGH